MKTETQWGYRVIETWTDDETGEPRSYTYQHETGSGLRNKAFAERKVEWINEYNPGKASLVSREVTYSDWAVQS